MEIKKIVVGPIETNCYILNKNNNQIIIDPGADAEIIKKHLTNPVAIIITHYHFDHTDALQDLIEQYNLNVIDYKSEKTQIIKDFKFEIIKVPGHHETCAMYKFDNELFTGDFLFKETIGRTDLETGDMNQMKQSLKLLKNYQNLNIYPGHGDTTTLDYEKQFNPYLNQ